MATVDFFSAFTYEWAETGEIFDWDDAQYKLGWATVGSTPPTVEQFNRVHQIADEKANWLYGQLKTVADAKSVTLSAGDLTGLQQVLAAYTPNASDTVRGIVELATTAEAAAGTDTVRAVTPAGLNAGISAMAVGRLVGIQVFAVAGGATYTRSAGVKSIVLEVQGGGGGGGGTENDSNAATIASGTGGGGGAYGLLYVASAPASAALTVGAGGAGGVGGFANGTAGTASSFGALLTAAGGAGGAPGRSAVNTSSGPTTSGGAGGVAPTGANIAIAGQSGHAGAYLNAGVQTGAGGNSQMGKGGSMLGSSASGFLANSAATGYGGGGGGAGRVGAGANGTGGQGSTGVIIVWEYA